MKVFWSFIALLVVATVVVFVVDQGSGTGHLASEIAQRVPSQAQPAVPLISDEAPAAVETANPLARRERTDHAHQTGAPTASGGATGITGDFLSFLGLNDETGVAEVTPEQRAKDEASRKARVAPLASGGIEIDDRFTVRGKGSEREPFTVPWELLLSAREVYVPKQGREIIPGRVTMLEGSRVQIEGFLMLPTVRDDVREFVVMKNQWDGCCIGTPPTPYDSVEVSLLEPIDFGFGMRQSATITGRLTVDPYLFGKGTLLGLYTIEDAKIEVTEW